MKMHYDNLFWMVFSAFWAANAILLIALFQSNDCFLTQIKWTIVPLFGVILSIIWYIIVKRIFSYQRFYDKLIVNLENELKIDNDFRTNPENKEFYPRYFTGGSIKPIMQNIPSFGAIGWLIGLIFGFLIIPLICY